MKKRRAVIVGFDYYAELVADLMNEHSKRWHFRAFGSSRAGTARAMLAMRRADALISFGGPAPDSALCEAARRADVPVFIIWAGSDVIKAQNDPLDLELIKRENFIHLSDGPWLVDELKDLGIDAEYLPLTAVRSGGPLRPFPRQFRVLTNLPASRREFYGAEIVYHVARAMPDVSFTVVGAGGGDKHAPANVHFCGRVNDMEDRIDASTVILRMPQHDGKSMLVLEALARARYVIWNYEFPAVTTAKTSAQVLDALRHFRDMHAAGTLELNHEGRAFALEHFSREDIARAFEARLETGLHDHAARTNRATRRVAISGLSLFCAEVAQYAEQFLPEWEPNLLRVNSRMEVLTSILRLASCDVWYTIGGPITDRWLYLAAHLLRKRHVIHWVGSDIAKLHAIPGILEAVQGPETMHLAEVEWTANQLRAFGLQPRIAPLPPRNCSTAVKPLPQKFTILLYVPRTRADFYGVREFERLMARLNGEPIRYLAVGGGQINPPDGVDATNLGWRHNLDDVYDEVTTLIRFTRSDGLSLMVLEALTRGRHVLWTQRFPFTTEIHTYDDMEREVRSLLQAHKRGELSPQKLAAQRIQQDYSPQKCMLAIGQAWSEAANAAAKPALAAEPS
jgi:hypothetical protein